MDREQHLAWAKERAKELINAGDIPAGMASISSDLMKHDDTIEIIRDNTKRIVDATLTMDADLCLLTLDMLE